MPERFALVFTGSDARDESAAEQRDVCLIIDGHFFRWRKFHPARAGLRIDRHGEHAGGSILRGCAVGRVPFRAIAHKAWRVNRAAAPPCGQRVLTFGEWARSEAIGPAEVVPIV